MIPMTQGWKEQCIIFYNTDNEDEKGNVSEPQHWQGWVFLGGFFGVFFLCNGVENGTGKAKTLMKKRQRMIF